MASFGRLLNSLPCPVQFLCESQVIKPEEWVLKVTDDDYREFIEEHVNSKNTVEKNFYVAFHANDQLELNTYNHQISEGLRRMGLRFEECKPDEPNVVPELTPNHVKIGDWYHDTLIVYDWPYSAQAGWLEDLYNMEKNINISMVVHPQDGEFALRYLAKRIAQRSSTVVIKEDADSYQHDLDEQLDSASLMRDELYKNHGKFFFMSFYVTVKAKSLEQLQYDTKIVCSRLRSMMIKFKHAMFRQDDGFRCTLPHSFDYLKSYYNITTTPLQQFLPFLSANIIERDGILMGVNLLNQSLIFLNQFAYSTATMLVVGTTGSGKSYTVKSQIDKHSKQGVDVTVLDLDNEYAWLGEHNSLIKVVKQESPAEYRSFLKRYLMQVDSDYINRKIRPRLLVIDEFWRLMQDKETAMLIQEIVKTGRKRWLALCVITQEFEDLLKSPYANSIVNNATFKIVLKMQHNQCKIAQKTFALTDQELHYLTSAEKGEGILIVDNNHIQFKTIVSDKLHRVITTDPCETTTLVI